MMQQMLGQRRRTLRGRKQAYKASLMILKKVIFFGVRSGRFFSLSLSLSVQVPTRQVVDGRWTKRDPLWVLGGKIINLYQKLQDRQSSGEDSG